MLRAAGLVTARHVNGETRYKLRTAPLRLLEHSLGQWIDHLEAIDTKSARPSAQVTTAG